MNKLFMIGAMFVSYGIFSSEANALESIGIPRIPHELIAHCEDNSQNSHNITSDVKVCDCKTDGGYKFTINVARYSCPYSVWVDPESGTWR